MKKLIGLFVLGLFACSCVCNTPPAEAADVYVKSGAKFYAPKDFDAGMGLNAKAVFPDVFVENLDLGVGLEYFATESDKIKNKELDIIIVPVEATYNYEVNDTITVSPVVGLDLYTGNQINTTVGAHLGAEVAVKTPVEGLSAVVGAGYNFATIEVSDIDHEFDGVYGTAGVAYKW